MSTTGEPSPDPVLLRSTVSAFGFGQNAPTDVLLRQERRVLVWQEEALLQEARYDRGRHRHHAHAAGANDSRRLPRPSRSCCTLLSAVFTLTKRPLAVHFNGRAS